MKKYVDYEKLRQLLREEPWDGILCDGEVNAKTDKFMTVFTECLHNSTKEVKYSRKKFGNKDWVTSGILKSINKKNEMYKKLLRDPLNTNLREIYNRYRNKLLKIISNQKRSFSRRALSGTTSGTKTLWQAVNNICGQNFSEKKISRIKTRDGVFTENEEEIAEELNLYFSEVGRKYSEKITEPRYFEEEDDFLGETMFLYPTDETEVQRTIEQLKNGLSAEYYGFRTELLKEVKIEISKPLAYFINNSFETGTFPDLLKIGIPKPIFKSGDRSEATNYRPISLISNISKVMEKNIEDENG
ncbi:uncharacterized protein LOC123682449 [Harmonia axyridis]|uniref:uncharacterized protein LOC123682449 n=1 Tax=Harmonia axyridis TaxID=115357 RepID=UPI001E275293|nr:uncharacterized protein LOC123682449 [Harmonia axyridis]